MKKILFIAIMMTFATTASADGYTWLKLRLADGTEQSLTAEGLKITFSDGNLVATANDGQTTTVALGTLSAMYFSNSLETGISATTTKQAEVSISGGRVYVSADKDAEVIVANTRGMMLSKRKIAAGTQQTVSGKLPAGVYIIKVNDTTTKICIE